MSNRSDSYSVMSGSSELQNLTTYFDNMTPSHVFERHTWTTFLAIHSPAALWIDRSLTPIWYFIGIIGNLVSAKIWSQRRMRRNNSSAVYLIALSISDYVFLILHTLQELKYSWGFRTLEYPFVCEIYFLLILVAQYLSPMLVLCFTVERYIAVCIPFSKEKYCTSKRATRVVLALVCVCFGLCAIQAYFWTYNYEDKECRVRPEVMEGDWSLWTIWSWVTEMLIFLVVPLFILVFNALVIQEVRRLTSCQSSLLAPPHQPASQASRSVSPVPGFAPSSSVPAGLALSVNSNALDSGFRGPTRGSQGSVAPSHGGAVTTVMLLSVSFYVIVTTLPATLVYVLHSQFPEGNQRLSDREISGDPVWRRYLVYITTRKIVEEICLTHYACNFFLYCITGEKFREILVDWLQANCWWWGEGGRAGRNAGRRLTRLRSDAGERTLYASIDRGVNATAKCPTSV